jgi:class 3 adenylate cyclase
MTTALKCSLLEEGNWTVHRELGDPKIAEHRGRIVKTTGDGLLAEFASVVDAVRCAVEIQREMFARNAAAPAERRIEFRMGINVGDIIIEDGDIFGDGVNIAARLEALAKPGGICLSAAAHEQPTASRCRLRKTPRRCHQPRRLVGHRQANSRNLMWVAGANGLPAGPAGVTGQCWTSGRNLTFGAQL